MHKYALLRHCLHHPSPGVQTAVRVRWIAADECRLELGLGLGLGFRLGLGSRLGGLLPTTSHSIFYSRVAQIAICSH